MSALEEILAQKPETFEEAKKDSLTEILQMQMTGEAPTHPAAPDTRRLVRVPATVPQTVSGEGMGFGESFKQGFIEDADVRIRRLAQKKFPDDPNAMNRFGIVDGEIVFVNDQGILERASSGAADVAGKVLSLSPEIAGSVAGTFASGNPAIGGAVGAAGGSALKDIIGGMIFGDPKTPVGVLQDMGAEFALDLATAGIGKGVAGIANRRAVQGVDESVFKSEAKRQAVKEATGIELDLAQVTNLPKLKALKLWARNFPGEASEIIRANDELIAGQVDTAITRVLNAVAKEGDTAVLGKNAINAADAAITAARAEVASKVSPLYQQAFSEGSAVDIKPVVDLLKEKLATAKGSRRQRLLSVLATFKAPGKKKGFDTSVQGLHGSKLAIDEMFEGRGSEALGNTIKRDLVEVKGALLDQLSEASPAYDLARKTFDEETARLVDPLRNGIVGVLASVPDQKAATAAARMFADGNVNAAAIRTARRAIEQQNPEAWNGIVRQWLGHQFNAASKELQTGQTMNVAGKFRQRVIGTSAQREAMIEALGPNARQLFETTMEALQFVSRTPTSSSATEFNRLITEEMRGAVGSIGRAMMQPRATGIRAIEDNFLQKQATRIAEALTDPSKVNQLKVLSELRPSTEKAAIAASIIGLSILPRDAAGNLIFPEGTRLPPILQGAQ